MNRSTPPEGEDLMEHLKSKYGEAAVARYGVPGNPLDVAGAKVGVTFNPARRVINTLDCHRLMEYCKNTQPPAVAEACMSIMFRRYFQEARDLNNREELLEVALELELDSTAVGSLLDSDEYKEMIVAKDNKAKNGGVSGVPFFIIGEGAKAVKFSGAQEPDVIAELLENLSSS